MNDTDTSHRVRAEWDSWLQSARWSHFATLTTRELVSVDRIKREFDHGFVRRVAKAAQRPLAWFYAIEPHADGERYHVHALLAHTETVKVAQLERAWRLGNTTVVVYDPRRGAAAYVGKYLTDNPTTTCLAACCRLGGSMSPPDKPRKRRSARPKASLPAVIDPRTPEEEAFVAAHEAVRQDRTQCAPKMRSEEPDWVVAPDTNDAALWRAQIAAALGVRDRDAQTHLITQLACVFREGAADTNANAAIALIREIAPRNAVEALLIAQMVAVHNAALEQLRRVINHLYYPPEVIDSMSNQATRLLRLFVDQLAALDRLRGGGGRQTVRVERVTVEAGGQAVVGAVTTTPVAASPAAPQDDGARDA